MDSVSEYKKERKNDKEKEIKVLGKMKKKVKKHLNYLKQVQFQIVD